MKRARVLRWGCGGILLVLAALVAFAYATSDNACGDAARAAPRLPMRAIVYCEYGPPDVLHVETVEKPVPREDEVLVRVRAAALNPLDWHYVRGRPYFMRAVGSGLRVPKSIRIGVDFAGTVEGVGSAVTRFRLGDEVFGGKTGAWAEYVCLRQDGPLARTPASITAREAAGIPIAGLTALQALRDRGKVEAGQSVLINGASGGVGTFAVQIARAMGAVVTGVCSARNADLVRSLGADRVIDYTREDFAASTERYDVILDNVGTRALSDFRRVLKPEGRLVLVGGGGPDDHRLIGPLARMASASVRSLFTRQELRFFMADMKREDLEALADLIASGRVRPIVDREYPLHQAAEALRYLETGRARAKIVLTVEEPPPGGGPGPAPRPGAPSPPGSPGTTAG